MIPGPVTRFLLVGATVVLTLSGCATLTVVPPERLADQRFALGAAPVAHIYAANWGVYLFKYLPLVTGSLARPGVPRFPALFSDQVRIDSLVEKVSEQSKQLGEQSSPTFEPATARTTCPGRCSSG